MPYNRYYPQQNEIGPQEANWLGGMAYNPYSKGTDVGFTLRQTLNNLLGVKQQQDEAKGEMAVAEAKARGEQAELARKAQIEERRVRIAERRDQREQEKALTKPQTERDRIAADLVTGGFAKDIPGAQMLIGGYATAAEKDARAEAKARAADAKAAKKEAEKDLKAENKERLAQAKGLALKIAGKIKDIKKEPLGKSDPLIKDLSVMNNFIQRRMGKAIAGSLNDGDKAMLDKIAMAIESESLEGIANTVLPQGGTPAAPATNPAPPVLPAEVDAYMQKHPDADLAQVLKKYQEWSRSK